MEPKRLYRSTKDRMIGGVCGGIGEYLEVDPTAIRVAYALLTLLTAFSGIIVYLVIWIIMPEKR